MPPNSKTFATNETSLPPRQPAEGMKMHPDLKQLTPEELAEYGYLVSERLGMGFGDLADSAIPQDAKDRAHREAIEHVMRQREL